MRSKWTLVAILLVGVALLAYLVNVALGPRTLRVAVGPIGSPNLRVVVGFLQALQRERANLRLKLVLTEGTESSARALDEGRADLAVVRSDIAVPPETGTVAILRSDALYFLTKPGRKIEKVRDLRGKSIGLASMLPVNAALLSRVLAYYGVETSEVTVVQGTPQEIWAKASAGALDSLFVIAPNSDHAGRAAWQALAKSSDVTPEVPGRLDVKPAQNAQDDEAPAASQPAEARPMAPRLADAPSDPDPGLLPIAQAEAIVEEAPAFSTVDLVRGMFDSDPARPEEAMTTLAVTHRLVALRSLDETLISDLTRHLFSLRLVIARETPAANEIELPSTDDRGAKLPVHQGTIAYVEGETKTFFERFGDWFYIGVMAISLLGSLAAAIWSRVVAARHPLDIDDEQRALLRLIAGVQAAPSVAALEAIKPDIEDRRTRLLAIITAAPMDDRQAANLRFLLTELREAYQEKKAGLAS
jgi:TRAP-type uncharacterized transport system substrate-binding protein